MLNPCKGAYGWAPQASKQVGMQTEVSLSAEAENVLHVFARPRARLLLTLDMCHAIPLTCSTWERLTLPHSLAFDPGKLGSLVLLTVRS